MKIVYGLLGAFAVFCAWQMFMALRWPQDAIELSERECVRWIAAEYAHGRDVVAHDHWIKRGKLVVELLVSRPSSESSDVILCIADRDSGDLLKPSAFDAHNWR